MICREGLRCPLAHHYLLVRHCPSVRPCRSVRQCQPARRFPSAHRFPSARRYLRERLSRLERRNLKPGTLIVNADDFGLTPRVTEGIVRAMTEGVVTSTSAMLCTPHGAASLRTHRELLRNRAGVHLQLTGGPGFPPKRAMLRDLVTEPILREWHTQMRAFLDSGLEPTHIDSHHHVHKEPAAFEAYCEVAREYGVPARSCSPAMTMQLREAGVACPDAFECSWTSSAKPSREGLLAAVSQCFLDQRPLIVELMCHPGYTDAELLRVSGAAASRELELAVLCDPSLRAILAERGVEISADRAISGTAKEFP